MQNNFIYKFAVIFQEQFSPLALCFPTEGLFFLAVIYF